MGALRDDNAELIEFDDDGITRVDGFPVWRLVVEPDTAYLEYCDRRPQRCAERGTRFVAVGLSALMEKLEVEIQRRRDEKTGDE